MAHQVPKFIEEETKLMGLITFTQLWILLGFAFILIILFSFLQLWLWFIIFVFLAPLGLFLTFGKIHDQPIHILFIAAIRHFWLPKYYLWQKEQIVKKSYQDSSTQKETLIKTPSQKTLDKETLNELTQILDK